jgi:hypothetical protein
MLYRICGSSVLTSCAPGVDPRPALDEAVGLGFTLVRIFCGALPWKGQAIGHVYDNLPTVLAECGARGLNAYLAYHTEAGTGYDLERHTDEVEAIARANPTVVVREVGNELDHATQGGRLPPERAADLADRMDRVVLHGATITDDESMIYSGREGNAVHLDRGRDPWNMVRRVREIYGRSEANGLPSTNQEPIGAAEVAEPGSRLTDPAIFLTMGALGRLFDCLSVFHSDDGLQSNRLGPRQLQCAQAFVRGFRTWPGAEELQYRNTGHGGSPVKAADFDRVIRVYSGVAPDWRSALTVALGLSGSLADCQVELNEGWAWTDLLAEMTGEDGRTVQVWRTTSDGSAMVREATAVQQRYPVDSYVPRSGHISDLDRVRRRA